MFVADVEVYSENGQVRKMLPSDIAAKTPDKPAYIMALSGQVVSYCELERGANRFAHLLRSLGLKRGDAIAIFMENNAHYFQLCWGAQRIGLYYTCVSSYLTAEEVDYIVGDCGARVFITSNAKANVAEGLLSGLAKVEQRYMVDGTQPGYESLEDALSEQPATPVDNPSEGSDMLYSSGTTGRPKGIKSALKDVPYGTMPDGMVILTQLYRVSEETVYLSPAPLYHAAPLRFNLGMQRLGATCIIMERFDPEFALELIEKYRVTHSQWVPTMFIRMLKLPKELRIKYDFSSHKVAVHAAAPCPQDTKRQMIAWWGPIINEYYAGTEGNGFCAINSADWLSHEGSVGKALIGVPHIVDDDGGELGPNQEGLIYFSDGPAFEYYNDPEKTAATRNDKGWSTLGDVGYLDDEGFLYLTDRKAYMIISGGINIYPQEVEDLLVMHAKVMDVAVVGVPNEDFGEEVKAVVQPVDGVAAGAELEAELIAHCRAHLSHIKCPRSIDFEAQLPRHDNGKLYKRLIRDRYWGDHKSRIV